MEIHCNETPVSIWTSDTSVWQCLSKRYMRKFQNLEDSEATVVDSSNLNGCLVEKSRRFIAPDKNNVCARKSIACRKVGWKKLLVKEQTMDSKDFNRSIGETGAQLDCTSKDASWGCRPTDAGHYQRIVAVDSQHFLATSLVSFEDGLNNLKSIPFSTSLHLINNVHDPTVLDRVQDNPLRRFRRCLEHHHRRYRLLRHVYTTQPHKRQVALSDQLQQWDQPEETGLLLGSQSISGNDAVINGIDSPLHDSIITNLRIKTHLELQSNISSSSLINNNTLEVTVNICATTDNNNGKSHNYTDGTEGAPHKAALLDITSTPKRAIQSITSRLGFRSNWFNLLDRLALWLGAVLALLLATAVVGDGVVRRRGEEVQDKKKKEGLYKQGSIDHKERRRMGSAPALLALMILAFGSYASACNQDACTNSFVSMKSEHSIIEGHNAPYCTLLRRYRDCTSALGTVCRGDLKYHAHLRVINSLLTKRSCALLQEDLALLGSMDMRSDDHGDDGGGDVGGRSDRGDEPLDECDFAGAVKPRAHCGLFGDPHLRTFQGEFVTCRVLGAWPLLDTPDLAVQVTNQRVGENLHATATTKVTAIIKGRDRCGPGRTYEASTDQLLPKAFVDGTSAGGGPDPARPAVWVKEVVSGQHIEIRIRYINATVSVRRIDKYLAVSATLPHAVAAAGEELGLCVTGCPPSEMMDAPLATAMPKDKALELCSHYNLTDYFLDSCVFDLMTTGDSYFRQAAAAAQAELWTQDPIAAASTLRNCTEWPCQWQVSGATTMASRAVLCSVAMGLLAMFFVSKVSYEGL